MDKAILRVFPRQTPLTPTDSMVRIGEPSMFEDFYEEIHVSVTFTWDIEESYRLMDLWADYTNNIKIGG